MDSGLARFAVLIVLFFLLTGDLAGMVKHMFEESGYGGKQQQQQQQRNRQQSPATKSARGGDVRPAKAATAKGLDGIDSGSDEDPDMEAFAKSYSARMKLVNTIKESCLPKLICELTASTNRDSLTESERYLLSLIRYTYDMMVCNMPVVVDLDAGRLVLYSTTCDEITRETTISTTAEVTSKYHFAAHMGQLINGIDNTGCHNFYPGCPFPGLQVMQMMKKVKIL